MLLSNILLSLLVIMKYFSISLKKRKEKENKDKREKKKRRQKLKHAPHFL